MSHIHVFEILEYIDLLTMGYVVERQGCTRCLLVRNIVKELA